MKISLDANSEWGYIIDPQSFMQIKMYDEIPEGFFFIIKRREYVTEIERTVVKNAYGRIKAGKTEKLDKKEMADFLSIALAKYILKNRKLPQHVKIKGELKYTKPVIFGFFIGNYDIFHLKIDSIDLKGENPKEIVDEIISKSSKNLFMKKREDQWKIEYARTGSSKCYKCKILIDKDSIRLGEPIYYREYLSFRWYHENCIDWSKFSSDRITGMEDIKTHEKRRIELKLKK